MFQAIPCFRCNAPQALHVDENFKVLLGEYGQYVGLDGKLFLAGPMYIGGRHFARGIKSREG